MNVDLIVIHIVPFKDTVYMSNLCSKRLRHQPCLEHIDDEEGEIALCILVLLTLEC